MNKFACAAAVAALAAPFAAFAEEAPATSARAAPAANSAAPSTTAPSNATPPTAGAQAGAQAQTGANANYTDAQVRAFIAASEEIGPVQQAAGSSALTPAQVNTIRAALGRHQLDGATYNAMAQRARSDQQFAARVEAARASTTTHRQ